MKSKIKRLFSILIVITSAIFIVFMINAVFNRLTVPYSHICPDYSPIDITVLLSKSILDDKDYKTLFYQTGLGRYAVDMLINTQFGKEKILQIQKAFFAQTNTEAYPITPFTYEENNVDKYGNRKMTTRIGYLDNGYILVTRATYTFGWRHGHAAIVVDKDKGYILESAVLGEPSQLSHIRKFQYYPNFIILKLKNCSQDNLDIISKYAYKNMYKVPYRLCSGILIPKYSDSKAPIGTHCSHLVWYPFKHFGYDIDSNGGRLVTPKDIANSDLLEIVQFYGFDADELWK